MSVLVIAEHDNKVIKPSTLPTIAAATKLGGDVHVLVAGHDAQSAADGAAQITGVSKVLYANDAAYEHGLAENIAKLVAAHADNYSHVLAPASFFGKNVLPRAAALKDAQQISDITGIESEDTFVRPIYAGNAFETVQIGDPIKFISIRATGFDPAPADGGNGRVESIESTGDTGLTSFVGQEVIKSERPDLSTASVVISGGRALGSGENFEKLIEPLADKLNAAIGASRAAVDAGYVPNDLQVGQTGKIVAPNLYIAIGISGAIQHLAGMKDSKVIVAINKDEDAPIFQIADYGLVGDLFEILPQLEEELG